MTETTVATVYELPIRVHLRIGAPSQERLNAMVDAVVELMNSAAEFNQEPESTFKDCSIECVEVDY